MFINVSNHPSLGWSQKQLDEARRLGNGEVHDLPFPDVDPWASPGDIEEQGHDLVDTIVALRGGTETPMVVMLQGELSLCVATIDHIDLWRSNIQIVVATTKRESIETKIGDKLEKRSIFSFVQFRRVL